MLAEAGIAAPTPTTDQAQQDRPPTPDGEELDTVWVASDLTPTGVYVTTVGRGNRVLATLDRFAALRWADAFTRHMAYARYDAAVCAQLKHVGINMVHIGGMINDLRKDRTPVAAADTYPLVIEPMVSHRDLRPRLGILDGRGEPFKWDIPDAEQHVHQVLELSAVTDVDAVYFRLLKHSCGLDEARARAVLGDLGHFRDNGTCGHDHGGTDGR